jgi:hypothetical protein
VLPLPLPLLPFPHLSPSFFGQIATGPGPFTSTDTSTCASPPVPRPPHYAHLDPVCLVETHPAIVSVVVCVEPGASLFAANQRVSALPHLPSPTASRRLPPRSDGRRSPPCNPLPPTNMCLKVVHKYGCGHETSATASCATSRTSACGVNNVKTIKHEEKCEQCDH